MPFRSWLLNVTLALLGCAILFTFPASAALRIGFDPGGSLIEYITKYQALREMEAKVVLDGMCISACTLITGILEDENVCVTSKAQLVFHSARGLEGHSSEGTRLAWNLYPEKVRAILRKRGWDGEGPDNAHPNLIYVEGAELRTIYRDCSAPSA